MDYAEEEGKEFASFSSDAAEIINNYDWPGNIRQLQNVIRNSIVLNDGQVLTADMLPELLGKNSRIPFLSGGVESFSSEISRDPLARHNSTDFSAQNTSVTHDIEPLWVVEKRAIELAIEACDGSIPKAASMLDINPSTIYRKKVQWDQG